jgi:hypothetical protein
MTVDQERDLVFVPTGGASPDYYGRFRLGDNKLSAQVCIAQPFKDFNVQEAVAGGVGPCLHSFNIKSTDRCVHDLEEPFNVSKILPAPAVSKAEKGDRRSTTLLSLRS